MHVITKLAASVALISALAVFGATPSSSATLQLGIGADIGVGNQGSYPGVGLVFEVSAPITFTQIGIYNSYQDGGGRPATDLPPSTNTSPLSAFLMIGPPPSPGGPGGVLASATFSQSSPGTYDPFTGYLFKSMATPVTVIPGVDYYLMGYGWNGDGGDVREHNSNGAGGGNNETFNTFGGSAQIVASVTGFGGPGTLSDITWSNGNPDYFAAANLSTSATPLPSTWLMLLTGFVGLGYFAYRGTKKRSAALAAA